jgi:hypothetical protein
MGDWSVGMEGELLSGLGEGKGWGAFFFGDDVILGNFKRWKKGFRGVWGGKKWDQTSCWWMGYRVVPVSSYWDDIFFGRSGRYLDIILIFGAGNTLLRKKRPQVGVPELSWEFGPGFWGYLKKKYFWPLPWKILGWGQFFVLLKGRTLDTQISKSAR